MASTLQQSTDKKTSGGLFYPLGATVRALHHAGSGIPDISWFGSDGYPPEWNNSEARTLCCMFDGSEEQSSAGDYQLFAILNADYRVQDVSLPALSDKKWFRVIDTSLAAGSDFAEEGQEIPIMPMDIYLANPRSTVVLLAK